MKGIEKFSLPRPLDTAVLFLVFNRLDTTRQVFEAIRKEKPLRLYVAADGARKLKDGEDKKVREVRDFIMSNIDWDCEIKTLFCEKNQGCKMAISSAISWFFSFEDMGIILEDDVVPKPEFFYFCNEGLNLWKSNSSIAGIGGFTASQNDKPFLSTHGSVWGWATWKVKWKMYNENQLLTDNGIDFLIKNSSIFSVTDKIGISKFLKNNFVDTWDYFWLFSKIENKQYMVLPGVALTNNIGFDNNPGTHNVGIKPKALIDAENVQITKSSVDHKQLSFIQSNVVINDYKRVIKRQGLSAIKIYLRTLVKYPLITSKASFIHFSSFLYQLVSQKKIKE